MMGNNEYNMDYKIMFNYSQDLVKICKGGLL